jgi:hypothetical protein
MNPERLPDDVTQWPSDPLALLGVDLQVDRRELRRVYAQLIRIYKPEHSPEQFRRIREAYEVVEQFIASRAAGGDGPVAMPPASANTAPQTVDAAAFVPPDAEPPRRTELDPREIDLAWHRAKTGDAAGAYRRLAELAGGEICDDELFVRLYWLLQVAPEADPDRDPRDWLAAGLRRLGPGGRLLTLYRAELADDPREVLSDRSNELFDSSTPQKLLAELAIDRWRAADTIQRHDVICRDLEKLRPIIGEANDVLWARLLMGAMDQLAWNPQPEIVRFVEQCRAEVERIAEHQAILGSEVNHRDLLFDLVKGWGPALGSATIPDDWLRSLRELLKTAWNRPTDTVRPRLISLLTPLVRVPSYGLQWLDELEKCAPVLHHFGRVIEAFFHETHPERPRRELAEVHGKLVEFLGRFRIPLFNGKSPKSPGGKNGPIGREHLLTFCAQASITAAELVTVISASNRVNIATLMAPACDPPFQYLCLAYQAFWA